MGAFSFSIINKEIILLTGDLPKRIREKIAKKQFKRHEEIKDFSLFLSLKPSPLFFDGYLNSSSWNKESFFSLKAKKKKEERKSVDCLSGGN